MVRWRKRFWTAKAQQTVGLESLQRQMIVLDVHVCFSRRQKDKQGSNDGLTKKKEKERSLSSYCVSCKGESGRTSLFCGGNVITWHDDLLFSDWCDDTWETHIGPDKFFPSVWSRHFTLYFCVWSRKWANRVTARSCCCCFFIYLYFFAVIIRILYSLPKRASPSSSSPWYI